MDFTRIKNVIDVVMMATKTVTVIGVGGAANLCRNLLRCGLGTLKLVDFDRVGEENLCRQEYARDQIGMFKTEATAAELARINPKAMVIPFAENITDFSEVALRQLFGDTDVFVFATDSFEAQSFGNRMALMMNRPAVWIGVYPGGRAGEIVFWHPKLRSCYRCLCSERYKAFENGFVNPTSDGADILSVQLVDSIAAKIVIGLLTKGADNAYGKLIEQLGERNFLQIKIDPEWRFLTVDPVQKYLGIPEGTDGYLSFCTVARRDPDPQLCPDCTKYRSPKFIPACEWA